MFLTEAKLKQLLSVEKPVPKIETVNVPEWGGIDVRVRVLTGSERDWWEMRAHQYVSKNQPVPNFRASLIALALCEHDGTSISGTHEIEKLGALPADGLRRVYDVAATLNGISLDAVEDAEKNSESATGSDSDTSSPHTLDTPSNGSDGT